MKITGFPPEICSSLIKGKKGYRCVTVYPGGGRRAKRLRGRKVHRVERFL